MNLGGREQIYERERRVPIAMFVRLLYSLNVFCSFRVGSHSRLVSARNEAGFGDLNNPTIYSVRRVFNPADVVGGDSLCLLSLLFQWEPSFYSDDLFLIKDKHMP
ncbi:hypothetical protein AYI68_g2664 [Smittium mucronatum]|uniref:Uncharacterized protein n=1 Tax=Smittium mucronatum TaxID=133383 RepID=A0A1R0H233_9FUNG|nr:hypothetical protein AYI68_g2664 [Smittium mucronatum]